MTVRFGVLGPVAAWREHSTTPVPLRGPRHRAVLARLLVARGRVVPVTMLVDDLWDDPPAGAVGALRTFVGDLRRALEPERPARTPSTLLVTEAPGYALRPQVGSVDADRFESVLTRAPTMAPGSAVPALAEALSWWRGPAYADVTDEHWARSERARLGELRWRAVELLASARLDTGQAAEAIPDLDAHVVDHPWREEGWRLLAHALYLTGRQAEALRLLRRARTMLVEELGLDPGIALRQAETDILNQAVPGRPVQAGGSTGAGHVARPTGGSTGAGHVARPTGASLTDELADEPGDRTAGPSADEPTETWTSTAALYDRTVAPESPARLRSTVDLLRSLAVTGGPGLATAQARRLATIRTAEASGDVVLTARVIGGYDVPAVWSRADDPARAAQVVAAAERTLVALTHVEAGPGTDALRARLLATVAVESRGTTGTRAREAAVEAEALARRLQDPGLLVVALNGRFMQSFHGTGHAAERDAVGRELVEVSARHGLTTHEVLGHLVRMQARAALGDLAGADRAAQAADRLALTHESPLVTVFTTWFRAMRLAATGAHPSVVEAAYRGAADGLVGAGMPGLRDGLLALAVTCLRVQRGMSLPRDLDPGPYAPWTTPLMLLDERRHDEARASLAAVPDPPPDHLLEASWCLVARAAVLLGDRDVAHRALAALQPAVDEQAGAGSGVLTLGPVARYVDELRTVLDREPG